MNRKKALALVVMVGSPLSLSLAAHVVPQVLVVLAAAINLFALTPFVLAFLIVAVFLVPMDFRALAL